MFVRYDYTSGTSLSNLMADVTALLTGTTDKTTLSAACIQATTSITSTVSAGWSVYDANAGTNAIAYSAQNVDGTTFKYITVDYNTSNFIRIKCWESWNATTHVGTNCAYANNVGATTGLSVPISLSGGGSIFIGVEPRYLVVVSYHSTAFRTSYAETVVVIERTRDSAWDTASYGVPPVLFGDLWAMVGNGRNGVQGYMMAPRCKTNVGADLTGASAKYWGSSRACMAADISSSPYFGSVSKIPDASFKLQYPLMSVQFGNFNDATRGDMGGMGLGLYVGMESSGSMLDEVTYNAKQYVIFAFGANVSGGARLLVPKF